MKTVTIDSSQHVASFHPGNRGSIPLWTTNIKSLKIIYL
jgi:hypothetical protein